MDTSKPCQRSYAGTVSQQNKPKFEYRHPTCSSPPVCYLDKITKKPYLIIVAKSRCEFNPHLAVIRYDIENNEYQNLINITDSLLLDIYGYFINERENKLYIINTAEEMIKSDNFIVDLNNNTYSKITLNIQSHTIYNYKHFSVRLAHFHQINNQTHIIYNNVSKGYHKIYDKTSNAFINAPNDTNISCLRSPSFDVNLCSHSFYIRPLNKLIIFGLGSKEDEVWIMDNADNIGYTQWRKSTSNVPKTLQYKSSAVIHGYDAIFYVFGIKFIWCFDANNAKWYKMSDSCGADNIYIPTGLNRPWKNHWISTEGRYCYIYDDNAGNKATYNENVLTKFDLFKITPIELLDIMKKRMTKTNNLMVYGFARECEKDMEYIFPDYLKRIVSRYADTLPLPQYVASVPDSVPYYPCT